MKTVPHPQTVLAGLAGLLLAWSAPAADDYIYNTFETTNGATEVQQWFKAWGAATFEATFDPTVDADGRPDSGSLKAVAQFDQATHAGDNQWAFFRANDGAAWGFWNGAANLYTSNYVGWSFDLMFDTNSCKQGDTFGNLERNLIPFEPGDPAWGGWPAQAVPTNGGWIHVTNSVPATFGELIAGVGLKIWSGNASDGMTGTSTFWLDNVKLIANTNLAPPPGPAMALKTAKPGLQLFASSPGNQYQRQGIRTAANNYAWNLSFDPIEYEMTIIDFPGGGNNGFQAHIFLAPITGTPGADPDWSQPNVIFLQIANNDDGSGYARFMYKTNQPGANAMLWNDNPANGPVGTLAVIGVPSPIGTWKLTINGLTSFTLTTPNGAITNFSMPSEAVALFVNPLYAYFGIQPNDPKNIDQSATFSQIKITGDSSVITPIDENFAAPTLNPEVWQLVAADANGVVVVPVEARYWLSWALPDTGFRAQSSPFIPPLWGEVSTVNQRQLGGRRAILLLDADLPGDVGFFRLIKE